MGQEKMPKVVYKYRVWNNEFHKRILINNEVYYSATSAFEDELDCNPPVDYPQGQELFIYILKYSMTHNLNKNYVWHIWNASKLYQSSPMSLPLELEKVERDNKDNFNKRFGVLSLAKHCNIDAMWNKYSDMHRGFCVGFDTYRLFSSIKGGCGSVMYVESLPRINFANDSLDEKIIKTVFYKEKKWEFEHEYRFHTMWDDIDKVERNCRLRWNSIVEVVLGKNMPSIYRQEIINIVKLKHPKARIIEER